MIKNCLVKTTIYLYYHSMKNIVLWQKFFDRNPVLVCQELLGKFLVIKKKWILQKYMITDVEAYDWQEDEASHARHGKTQRNAPMFGAPGCWYVYMIYGMYYMLNIVTGPGNHPSAILLRWLAQLSMTNDKWQIHTKQFNGPGKLTKKLCIDTTFNGKIADETTWLRIEESGKKISDIKTAPRIGIDYASDERKNKHRRFFVG